MAKVKGIRKRWMLNSISAVLLIVLFAVTAFSVAIAGYFYSTMSSGLEAKVRGFANTIRNAQSAYLQTARDTVEGFEHSLRQAIALQPENITVHTLTLKRASRIVIEDQKENDYADVAAMLEKCHLLAEAGYRPYYLYRQKNTLQNLENVGWCKPGHEGYYNIYIMEEVQTILSAGAGGSTKLVADGGKRMQRIFNFKYPNEYIQRFAEVLERKKGVAEFYDHDLGTETTG